MSPSRPRKHRLRCPHPRYLHGLRPLCGARPPHGLRPHHMGCGPVHDAERYLLRRLIECPVWPLGGSNSSRARFARPRVGSIGRIAPRLRLPTVLLRARNSNPRASGLQRGANGCGTPRPPIGCGRRGPWGHQPSTRTPRRRRGHLGEVLGATPGRRSEAHGLGNAIRTRDLVPSGSPRGARRSHVAGRAPALVLCTRGPLARATSWLLQSPAHDRRLRRLGWRGADGREESKQSRNETP